MTSVLRPLVAVIAGSVLATSLFAQTPAAKPLEFPAASPAATIKQRIGVTDVTVEYSRPSMRGRKIFGGLEPYGSVWRTGANSATKVTFSTDVTFGGKAVPAGSYALHTIPGESEWTVILNAAAGWGSYGYDAAKDVARVVVKPMKLNHPVETFAIEFSDLSKENAGTLMLAWENVSVAVKIEVDLVSTLAPKIEAVMASDEAKKPYFNAAMFYYENGLDLDKAMTWMEAGLAQQPEAFWMVYRKGLILAKKGDKAGVKAAAEKSLELVKAAAAKQPASLVDEYTRLNQALIASLK